LRSAVSAATALAFLTGCSASKPSTQPAPSAVVVQDQATLNPAAQAKADGGRPPFVAADVKFMQGMIHHHAQAILIAKWAPSHGASESVQKLCERIVVAQRDEIAMMSAWLRERKIEVPAPDTLGAAGSHAMHAMPGMTTPSPVIMPGMLTAQQVAQLEAARGRDFDRLFLRYMIQHHRGAITMVKELFGSYGAAQDAVIYRFAADVEADQGAEIERMNTMLSSIQPSGGFQEPDS
jgi:uncharacterized protein (DUF305 family)